MLPPPLDLPNERPFLTRCWVDTFGLVLRSVINFLTIPLTAWPDSNRLKTRVDTGKTGRCRVCIYTPKKQPASKPLGVVVYCHGGGWTICTPELEAPICRYLCDQLGVVVVAPDYRKAPQYPYPHALEQCYSVLTWVASGGLSKNLQKRKINIEIDPTRIALSGASSGSNLAASLTLLTLNRPLPDNSQISSLGLLYPALNLAVPYADKLARVDPNRTLPPWMSRFFLIAYLPRPRSSSDPYVSPALAQPSELARFPPTVVLTAEYDYLAHEAEEFAVSLRDVGVAVEHKRFKDVGHAFDGMPAQNRKQRRLNEGARDEAWGMMAKAFGEALK